MSHCQVPDHMMSLGDRKLHVPLYGIEETSTDGLRPSVLNADGGGRSSSQWKMISSVGACPE